MKQLCLRDERGQLIAFIGSAGDFESQEDGARSLGSARGSGPLAWIDWIESTAPGNGTKLMREALMILEAEGVSLIGLAVVPKDPSSFDRVVKFYSKFGFVHVAMFGPFGYDPLMFRDSSWNGME